MLTTMAQDLINLLTNAKQNGTIKKLRSDLYITLLVETQNGDKWVLKLYDDCSDDNNEYEVITFLYNTPVPEEYKLYLRFPKPLMKVDLSEISDLKAIKNIYKLCDLNFDIERNTNRGLPYKAIVYEYIEGKPVSSYAGKDTLTKDEAKHVYTQLQYMHEHGILHGDVKSDNIIIQPNGIATLIDYGRAFGFTRNTRVLFPPMKFMLDDLKAYDEPLPTQEEDFILLSLLHRK